MGHSQGQPLELRKLVLQNMTEEDGKGEHQYQSYRNRGHINSFPKYTSRYSRHYNPHKKYFPQYMSIKKMYELYISKCKEKNITPVKEWQ
jgi:hypothetical protein